MHRCPSLHYVRDSGAVYIVDAILPERQSNILIHLWHRCDGLHRLLLSAVADGNTGASNLRRCGLCARLLFATHGGVVRH